MDRLFSFACAALLLAATSAGAEYSRARISSLDPGTVSIDEARFLGTPLDPALPLIGEDGKSFSLGDLFGKPLLLLFSYYSCDGACPAVNQRLAQAVSEARRFRAGKDYNVLTLSFDRKDRPADIRRFVNDIFADRGTLPGWRFAVFPEHADVRRVAESVGYRFFWSVSDRMFVHPNVMIVLTPRGRVARYLSSWSVTGRDVDLALIESDWGRISGSDELIDIAVGLCYSYSYKEGRYVLNAPLFIAAGSLTLGLVAMIAGFSMFKRFRRKEQSSA